MSEYYYLQSHIIGVFVAPNAASVVLRARDYGVPLVVERTRKYLIRVPLQLLQQLSRLTVPNTRYLVEPSRQHLCPLWVKDYLRNVLFVP